MLIALIIKLYKLHVENWPIQYYYYWMDYLSQKNDKLFITTLQQTNIANYWQNQQVNIENVWWSESVYLQFARCTDSCN